MRYRVKISHRKIVTGVIVPKLSHQMGVTLLTQIPNIVCPFVHNGWILWDPQKAQTTSRENGYLKENYHDIKSTLISQLGVLPLELAEGEITLLHRRLDGIFKKEKKRISAKPFLLHRHTYTQLGHSNNLLLELCQPSRSLFFWVWAVWVGGALLAAVAAFCAFAHNWCCRRRRWWGLCRLIRHLCKPHLKDILQKKGGENGDKGASATKTSFLSFKLTRHPTMGQGPPALNKGLYQSITKYSERSRAGVEIVIVRYSSSSHQGQN